MISNYDKMWMELVEELRGKTLKQSLPVLITHLVKAYGETNDPILKFIGFIVTLRLMKASDDLNDIETKSLPDHVHFDLKKKKDEEGFDFSQN